MSHAGEVVICLARDVGGIPWLHALGRIGEDAKSFLCIAIDALGCARFPQMIAEGRPQRKMMAMARLGSSLDCRVPSLVSVKDALREFRGGGSASQHCSSEGLSI